MAYQWGDVLEGSGPASLADLPCDCWAVKEGSQVGTYCLMCFSCGWYRPIPESDVKAAEALERAVESFIDGYNNAMEAPEAWDEDG